MVIKKMSSYDYINDLTEIKSLLNDLSFCCNAEGKMKIADADNILSYKIAQAKKGK